MITAQKAFNETKHHATIIKIVNEIDNEIKKEIQKGNYEARIGIRSDTPEYVREEIRQLLKSLGYNFDVPVYKIDPIYNFDNAPCDQAIYYDYIKVNWR